MFTVLLVSSAIVFIPKEIYYNWKDPLFNEEFNVEDKSGDVMLRRMKYRKKVANW